MLRWHKPATLLLPLPDEPKAVLLADLLEVVLDQLLDDVWRFARNHTYVKN